MRKLTLIIFILFFINIAHAAEYNFNEKGDIKSDEILLNFIQQEIPNTDFSVVSHFCDIDNNGDNEIIGIIKSNLFYNLKGYKLFVLKRKDEAWVPIHSDINFDNTMPVTVEKGKIFYYGGVLYDGKKYTAEYKDNEIRTERNFFDFNRNRKIEQIENLTQFETGREKNKISLNEFHSSNQKNVNIYYKNLSAKTKHYLDMQ